MAEAMLEICNDLAAEKAAVTALLADLDEAAWDTPTPAEGWAIRDQISHLAFFDEKARLAQEDPEAFAAELAGLLASHDLALLELEHLERGRALTGSALLAWWDEANAALRAVFARLDPKTRVIWYGPPMAARSKITARIMETWAHGQDIRDALGVEEIPTGRLRHVCHIGVRARAFAFQAHGERPPEGDIAVDLEAPDGSRWRWGDQDAPDRVEGTALDFALLVTQRRHRADTGLKVIGAGAHRWLDIAQAFAGPPGPGRAPGQFG